MTFARKPYTRPPVSKPERIAGSGPARISVAIKPQPKSPRYEDKHLLSMARGQSCLLQSPICNRNCETTVACHGAGVAAGKGMGYKVGDHLTAWGCSDCNHYTDAYGWATAEEKASVFADGHKRQIYHWQTIATSSQWPERDRRAAREALAHLEKSAI